MIFENKVLKILIDEKGAELKSVFHKEFELEYMWQGNPAFWAKTSPVLFPIVGALKENIYYYQGKKYSLPRHGFAREKKFTANSQQDQSVTFTLDSDQQTISVYPFPFRFSIIYTLHRDRLSVQYVINNTGNSKLFFSVGGHPAFNVPLVAGTSYDDYQLMFNKRENAGRWPISKDGLIEEKPEPLFRDSNTLPLRKSLFANDAIVLKHLQSDCVRLSSDKTPHGLTFSFSGFPFLGLWASPGADFLCIEPWCGIADSVHSDQQLEHKEGILQLKPGDFFEVQWSVHFY